ncbi:hypothetical protein GCM10029964_071780 [Kibdelosporangium lantanae]
MADMTTVGSGGLLLTGIRYGAEAYQLSPKAAAGCALAVVMAVTAVAATVASANPAAASVRRCILASRWSVYSPGLD